MTVPSTRFREDYAGNGSATSFPYAFRIFKATDLVVTKTDNSGNETTLTLGTDYSVTGAGSYNGGAVVLTAALPTSYRLTIERVLAIRQDTDLRNQGEFLAETHEDAFDRLTMIVQRLAGYLGMGQDGTLRTLLLGTGDVDGAGAFRARGNRISGLSNPVEAQDAATKSWSETVLRQWQEDSGAAVRHDLSMNNGASLIGYGNSTVKDVIDDLAINPSIYAKTLLSATSQSTLCIIGDSISTGQGATYGAGWSQLFSASIFEAFDGDVRSDKRSLGYPLCVNMREFMGLPGVSGNGTPLIGYNAPSNESYRLAHNQYIEVTGRQAKYYDIFYDREINGSDMSAGNIEITVNGTLRATKAVTTGTGIGTTYPTGLANPLGLLSAEIRPTDVVRFTYKSTNAIASDRIYVVGVNTVRTNTNLGPAVVKFNYPGWTFDNWTPLASKIQSIVNTVRYDASTKELYLIALGTNSIYNASVDQTPAQYVASLQALLAALGINNTARYAAIWIPPKGNGAVAALGSYDDYVKAIRDFCATAGHPYIDLSNSALSKHSFLMSDALHPNAFGHAVLAADICSAFGIPYSPVDQGKVVPWNDIYGVPVLSSGWVNYNSLASNAPTAKLKNGVVYLSGLIAPSGATSGTAITLPGGFNPSARAMYVTITTSSGVETATISQGGVIAFTTFNKTWYSLDGVCFSLPLDK